MLGIFMWQPTAKAGINERACAIWFCLPQAFLPAACFPEVLLEFQLRKSLVFVPPLPPLHKCIMNPPGDFASFPLHEEMSFRETSKTLHSETDAYNEIRTDEVEECTQVLSGGAGFGQAFCENRVVRYRLDPLTGEVTGEMDE